MSTKVANTEGTPEDTPSIQKAANDLRAAATHRAQEVAHTAEERARQLKESAVEKTQQFRDAAGERAQHLKEVAGEKAQHLKEVAGEQWEGTRVKAREVHSDAEDYIRQHPTKAVLIAAGAGLLLGLIVRR
ncbi:MAG: DUF883 family protein [Akkermansiaceae bacterium]|nr:DUF883 family protein [Akkermansiaceae bacterium]